MIVMTPHATRGGRGGPRRGSRRWACTCSSCPGELTTAIGAIGDPEGVREARLRGHGGRRPRRPDLAPLQARLLRALPRRPERVRHRRAHGRRRRDVLPDRRAVHGRVARADDDRRAHGQGGGRLDAARRRLQAAHVAVRVQGARRRRARDPRRGARGDRAADRHRAARHASTPTSIAEYADVVQIGARNMQNYALLEVAGKLGMPVLLKRGLSSSLEELLMAADYVLKEGNERVMLCERGIRTFETATRFTLDLSAVPWLKLHSHLPVIVDPSHATGRPPAGRAARARRRRGRRRRHHRRGPQRPGGRPLRRPPLALRARLPGFARRVAAHAALDGKRSRGSAL